MDFEWDEVKAASNLTKHAISFVDAIEVFDDPRRLILDVSRANDEEWRGKIIGKMKETVIVAVIYTDRDGRTRIISARKARKDERELYDKDQEVI